MQLFNKIRAKIIFYAQKILDIQSNSLIMTKESYFVLRRFLYICAFNL